MLLRVQREEGWRLEQVSPEVFNDQVILWRVKEVIGVEPLSVDIVNDLDAILELPNDILVIRVGQELQHVVEWGAGGGYDVDVSSLMAKRPVILDVARTHPHHKSTRITFPRCYHHQTQQRHENDGAFLIHLFRHEKINSLSFDQDLVLIYKSTKGLTRISLFLHSDIRLHSNLTSLNGLKN